MQARSGVLVLVLMILVGFLPPGVSLGPVPASAPSLGDSRQGPEGSDAEPGAIEFGDNADDVSIQAGGQAVPAQAEDDAVDITNVRVFGETGDLFRIELTVKDIKAEGAAGKEARQVLTNGVDYAVCFTMGGKTYAVKVYFIYPGTPIVSNRWLGLTSAECNINGPTYGPNTFAGLGATGILLDPLTSKALFTIKRDTIAKLDGSAPPAQGTPITGVWAFARSHRPTGALRFDQAPDAAANDGSMAFVYPTANQDLQMRVDRPTSTQDSCGSNVDFQTFVIEAGGKRTVPVAVSNLLSEPRFVNFQVKTVEGTDWKPKVMPGIEVPASDGSVPGNLTVNVIVDTPAGTKHRECTSIILRGVDAEDSSSAGEVGINVIAAVPPSPQKNVFYLHADALATDACAGRHIWMNLEQNDERASNDAALFMRHCEQAGVPVAGGLSLENVAVAFGLDYNPSRDVVINSTVTGKMAAVKLNLRSDYAPTEGTIIATILASSPMSFEVLGEQAVAASLGTTAQTLDIDVPIFFTRETVAEGDPSRTVTADNRIYLGVRYAPDPVNSNVDEVRPAGKVMLLPPGSSLTLPIFATLKNNVNDPGASGQLVSLKALSDLETIANPGKVRALNFTLLNEGVATDVANVEASIVGGSKVWEARVAPEGPFTLGPGESVRFSVGITAPEDTPESEIVRLVVRSWSESDPAAESNALVKITATRGQQLVDEEDLLEDDVAGDDDGGFLPGPSLGLVALVSLGAAFALRRRWS